MTCSKRPRHLSLITDEQLAAAEVIRAKVEEALATEEAPDTDN